MLKYQFKIGAKTDSVQEIECESLYLSEDLDFISGITSPTYGLVDGQSIFVREGTSTSFNEFVVSIKEVTRRGYVRIDKPYSVLDFEYGNETLKGFVFADGKKYIAKNKVSGKEDVTVTVKDKTHLDSDVTVTIGSSSSVTITTKYWVEDNKIAIDDYLYEIDPFDKNPSIVYNGQVYYVNDWARDVTVKAYNEDEGKYYERTISSIPNIYKIVKFEIRKTLDYKLDVDYAIFSKQQYYFESGDTSVYTDSTNEKKTLLRPRKYIVDRVKNTATCSYYDEESDAYETDTVYVTVNYENQVTVNGEKYELKSEWKNASSGNYLHLYLDDTEYAFKASQKIKVTPMNFTEREFIVTESGDTKFVSFCGNKYYKNGDKADFAVVNGAEYRVYYGDDNWGNDANSSFPSVSADKGGYGYIQVDDSVYLVYKKGGKLYSLLMGNKIASFGEKELELKQYDYITIDDIDYMIYTNSRILNGSAWEYEYILVEGKFPIRLLVEEVISSNQLRCSVIGNDEYASDGLSNLVTNFSNYSFELENPLFDESVLENIPTVDKELFGVEYTIYKPISNINIPLRIGTVSANNLHQEFACEEVYFSQEQDKAVNRIVDMEKDVYYPAYYKWPSDNDNSADTFETVDEIVFDLHFRSRDLNTWKINEDEYMGKDKVKKCDWNILDYYTYNGDTKSNTNFYPKISFDNGYYLPPDLLYFLNFTDDDVFYQKSKVGKSFLRLSYYDSMDPRNQNLLHTATVFLNEGNLFKTYIDNMKYEGNYIGVQEIEDLSKRVVSKNISVAYDTCDGDTTASTVTAEDDSRLACKFTINNMFEASESSEGFYLYMFREFSTDLRPQTIYLKVEFNHAGVGRTINFMQPFSGDSLLSDGEMLDLSTSKGRELLCEGVPMNELFSRMYIPLRVKYCLKDNKYYYYLPKSLTKNNDNKNQMRFSLYEVKIKDESNILGNL